MEELGEKIEEKEDRERRKLLEDPLIQKVLQYKKQGFSDYEISRMLDIQRKESKISKCIQKCVKVGLITVEEIEKAEKNMDRERKEKIKNRGKEEKKQKILEKVLEYVKQGFSASEISEMEDIEKVKSTIIRYIKEGINAGLITKEGIEKAKEDRKQRELQQKIAKKEEIESEKRQKELEKERRIQRILAYKKQGMTNREISKMTDIHCSPTTISNYIRKCLELGLITKEEIEGTKKQGKLPKKENRNTKKQEEVKENSIDTLDWKVYLEQKVEIEMMVDLNRKASIQQDTSTKEPIKQSEMQIEEKKEVMQRFKQIKREIDLEVRLDKKISKEKEEKIREYIDLCYQIYQKEKISKLELEFLKRAIQKVPINDRDIVRFAKRCTDIEEYAEAYNMVRNRRRMGKAIIPEDKQAELEKLETSLNNACKLQKAMRLMNKGNVNTEVISSITGLSKEEVNILKIRRTGKTVELCNILEREKVIELLLQDKDPYSLQEKCKISDFEMEDIREQVEYRRIKRIRKEMDLDLETQVKQDSSIRIEMLCIKLGKSLESISEVLKLKPGEIEKHIKYALEFGLIKPNQLQGIKLLEDKEPKLEQLEK